MLIREVMKPHVEVISCDRSVREAAQMMARGDYGCLPVEKNDKMIGMITDRDIVLRVVAEGLDAQNTRVEECMTEGIVYCFDDETIESVTQKMSSTQHRRIPVIARNKRLVGIVSLGDVARKANNEHLTHQTLMHVTH